jgi:hypothetical protein
MSDVKEEGQGIGVQKNYTNFECEGLSVNFDSYLKLRIF